MAYPAFFDQVPAITVHDGLAAFIGAADDGLLTYRYVDAVRLAGHSCPTVAGAYLLVRRALQLLYPDQMPQRGEVAVQFSAPLEEGVTGVIANVASLITGAAGAGGFKGIGGRHCRMGLLDFGRAFDGVARFERKDNGAAVQLGMASGRVAADARTMPLLQKAMAGTASVEEVREFGRLWQERVRKMLLDHADDPDLIFMAA